MGYLLATFALIILTIAVSRGEWRNVTRRKLHLVWLLALAIAIQFGSITLGSRWTWLPRSGLMLLLSFALLLVFALANIRLSGMACIALGVILNATAICLNGGMPTRTPEGHTPIEQSAKHRPATDADHLPWLTDVIWLPPPVSSMISVGDVAITVGVCWVAYAVTRRRTDELDRAPTKQSA